jgi:hypothetical protein
MNPTPGDISYFELKAVCIVFIQFLRRIFIIVRLERICTGLALACNNCQPPSVADTFGPPAVLIRYKP